MIEYPLFNRLPSWSQVEVLTNKGTVVAQRNHKDWHITLYTLNNFFVELWEKPNLEIIGSFHSSVNPMAILEPYTQDIQIEDFYSF
ncbi:hypothetical protein [Adhaeribacter rhizoryzae]|uniref:Uncharacterized protein n=1 Tax=Adhaeribacter rhizoryzae TaxID=2607907 RepID=A0A5M6D0Y6_9BACT|nr:hypothetical protein [Adhaeribacter rhizoryzae]KAA5541147.1 hypothetical protein F0145_21165 [Adhaeribacter rhizoryzae]